MTEPHCPDREPDKPCLNPEQGCVPGGCFRVLRFHPLSGGPRGGAVGDDWTPEERLGHGHRWLEAEQDRKRLQAAALLRDADALNERMIRLRSDYRHLTGKDPHVILEDG